MISNVLLNLELSTEEQNAAVRLGEGDYERGLLICIKSTLRREVREHRSKNYCRNTDLFIKEVLEETISTDDFISLKELYRSYLDYVRTFNLPGSIDGKSTFRRKIERIAIEYITHSGNVKGFLGIKLKTIGSEDNQEDKEWEL